MQSMGEKFQTRRSCLQLLSQKGYGHYEGMYMNACHDMHEYEGMQMNIKNERTKERSTSNDLTQDLLPPSQ